MKDMVGHEICVGETIAYVSANYGVKMTVGTVVEVGLDHVRVERIHDGHNIRNGTKRCHSWSKDGRLVPCDKKPRQTTISMPARCYVVARNDNGEMP